MEPFNWLRVNHSEAYQAARRAGLSVSPDMSRDDIVKIIVGEDPPVDNPVDRWRDGIMAFILDHWVKLQSQLSCPAKSGNKNACYGCTDGQVMSCLVTNIAHRSDIERRKTAPVGKEEETMAEGTTILSKLDIDNAPRSREALKAQSRWQLKNLGKMLCEKMNCVDKIGAIDVAPSHEGAMGNPQPPYMVDLVLDLLHAWDAQNGNSKPAARPLPALPAPAPAPVATAEAPAPAHTEEKQPARRGRPPAEHKTIDGADALLARFDKLDSRMTALESKLDSIHASSQVSEGELLKLSKLPDLFWIQLVLNGSLAEQVHGVPVAAMMGDLKSGIAELKALVSSDSGPKDTAAKNKGRLSTWIRGQERAGRNANHVAHSV